MRPRSGRIDFLPIHFYHFYHAVGALSLSSSSKYDDTETTNQLYQDHYANMYALGFRLVVS